MSAAATLTRPFQPVPFGLLYYSGVRCPFCGGRHFTIRTVTAECALCAGVMIISNLNDKD
jgi:hypothetical protein